MNPARFALALLASPALLLGAATADALPLGGLAKTDPSGATGAIITIKALHELERTGGSKALITMCIGGGQGIALAIERL